MRQDTEETRLKRIKPSPSMLVALGALVIAAAGVAVAAIPGSVKIYTDGKN